MTGDQGCGFIYGIKKVIKCNSYVNRGCCPHTDVENKMRIIDNSSFQKALKIKWSFGDIKED
jgi:hypothetical protein